MNELEPILATIAQRHLQIDSLAPRHRDSLDFHDVSVWNLRAALEAAFKAGIEHGCSMRGAAAEADSSESDPGHDAAEPSSPAPTAAPRPHFPGL